jgi:hypothetical protein
MTERLAHDHAELDNLLAEVIAALEAKDIARSHTTLDLFWARLAVHIRAEHLRLFPAVLNALRGKQQNEPAPGDARSAIEELQRDHDFFMRELSQAVITTRGLLTNAGRQAAERELNDVRARVVTLQARLAKHNRLEEEGIYLWTSSLLSETERSGLASQVQLELTNMPPRFGGE